VLHALPDFAARFDPQAVGSAAPGSAGVFAPAAIPARWTLERRDWAGAAALEPTPSTYPYTDAMTYLARALGAAHTGKLDQARADAAALDGLRDKLSRANEAYWAEQVRIQHDEAAAFLALAEGRSTDALALLRATAVREDATEKNAVTPGPLAPARELLGEMLLELKQPAAALVEFQAVMKKEPRRFRAVYGAARAAQLSGNAALARTNFTQLITICQRADQPGRAEITEAREYLRKGRR
jgi:tetratricopeptide (TPR) repeat protein